ncbi:calpain [Holotrichia oblita]|uniref:Calpain n=1 Tax=Holotrichia oblita TaxID=644536 RepID=A0ACB9TST5_HOLOL|nr:calpain [Holotrichia oblita]
MTNKIYLLGELSGYKGSGKLQDFYSLREEHLKKNSLFEDDVFPADNTSISYAPNIYKEIKWRRPTELCKNPKLFIDGHSRFDAIQGYELGDCWVIAAIANLASHEELLHFVMPTDQSFDDKYAGIFHFRFWQYGKWVDVVIDDRLPYSVHTKRLFSICSEDESEFWSALIEKAYAKLHGSYQALVEGYINDALQDFTGGVTEILRRGNVDPTYLYEFLRKSWENGALMGCSFENKRIHNLRGGHAYSITNVKYVQKKDCSEKIPLLRIRNPWGPAKDGGFEWTGRWNDSSQFWQKVSAKDKQALGYVKGNDGEFWISFEDFEKFFINIEICHRLPFSVIDDPVDQAEREWKVSFFEGSWVKNSSAGGRLCLDCCSPAYYSCNPQYRITLTKPDKGSDKCTLLVGLLQKLRRQQKHLGVRDLDIFFDVYRLDTPDGVSTPLNAKFFVENKPVVNYTDHVRRREYTRRITVDPGIYCIVPNTHDKDQEGQFLLRVFAEQNHVLQEYDVVPTYDQYNIHKQVIDVCSKNEVDENERVNQLFLQHAGDTGTINWVKLKLILDSVLRGYKADVNFTSDTCKSLLAMLDVDQSGELSLCEFQALWKDIQHWKSVFSLYDKDDSGTLSPFELRNALNSVGFKVNARVLNLLMQRFRDYRGELDFEDFIASAVKLKTMINIFENENDTKTGLPVKGNHLFDKSCLATFDIEKTNRDHKVYKLIKTSFIMSKQMKCTCSNTPCLTDFIPINKTPHPDPTSEETRYQNPPSSFTDLNLTSPPAVVLTTSVNDETDICDFTINTDQEDLKQYKDKSMEDLMKDDSFVQYYYKHVLRNVCPSNIKHKLNSLNLLELKNISHLTPIRPLEWYLDLSIRSPETDKVIYMMGDLFYKLGYSEGMKTQQKISKSAKVDDLVPLLENTVAISHDVINEFRSNQLSTRESSIHAKLDSIISTITETSKTVDNLSKMSGLQGHMNKLIIPQAPLVTAPHQQQSTLATFQGIAPFAGLPVKGNHLFDKSCLATFDIEKTNRDHKVYKLIKTSFIMSKQMKCTCSNTPCLTDFIPINKTPHPDPTSEETRYQNPPSSFTDLNLTSPPAVVLTTSVNDETDICDFTINTDQEDLKQYKDKSMEDLMKDDSFVQYYYKHVLRNVCPSNIKHKLNSLNLLELKNISHLTPTRPLEWYLDLSIRSPETDKVIYMMGDLFYKLGYSEGMKTQQKISKSAKVDDLVPLLENTVAISHDVINEFRSNQLSTRESSIHAKLDSIISPITETSKTVDNLSKMSGLQGHMNKLIIPQAPLVTAPHQQQSTLATFQGIAPFAEFMCICKHIILQFGEKGSGTISKGDVQDFYKLREECLKNNILFEDPNFPADVTSLSYSSNKSPCVWHRPTQVCKNPQMFIDGASRFDVKQGHLNNCWLAASIAGLARYRELLIQVVPEDQDFNEKYAGIFHFRFWQYGKWVDVVIDDRLPFKASIILNENEDNEKGVRTIETKIGDLAYLSSSNENEFWASLLEKAYAKLHGSYEVLAKGNSLEAMQDFTGGISEIFHVEGLPSNFFELLLVAQKRCSLMTCCFQEEYSNEGLKGHHAYTVTDLREVQIGTGTPVSLIRIRNPWGSKFEWKGSFSDGDEIWKNMPQFQIDSLDFKNESDGEFWMNFEDFKKVFMAVVVCNLTPESLDGPLNTDKKWKLQTVEGQWVNGITAGGSDSVEKLVKNPQYLLTMEEADVKGHRRCSIILSLLQKRRRAQHLQNLEIGYYVLQVDNISSVPMPLSACCYNTLKCIVDNSSLRESRDLTSTLLLNPGTYCVIPCTRKENQEGEYLLRIYSESGANFKYFDSNIAYNEESIDARIIDIVKGKEKVVEDEAGELFAKYANGKESELYWPSLRDLLHHVANGFTKEVCRSLVAMLDVNRSGSLSLAEFRPLWADIKNWQICFNLHDANKSGKLEGSELRNALNALGFSLHYNVLNVLARRYSDGNGNFTLDDFLLSIIKLKTTIEMPPSIRGYRRVAPTKTRALSEIRKRKSNPPRSARKGRYLEVTSVTDSEDTTGGEPQGGSVQGEAKEDSAERLAVGMQGIGLATKRLSGAQRKKAMKARKMAAGTWTAEKPSKTKGTTERVDKADRPKTSGEKRPRSESKTPPTTTGAKRSKGEPRPTGSYSDTVSGIRRAVINRRHPDTVLTQEQSDLVQNTLADVLCDAPASSTEPLQFYRTMFSAGVLWMTCANHGTAQWLESTVASLGELLRERLGGAELRVVDSTQLPARPRVLVHFGEKGSGTVSNGDLQDFYKLREDCLRKNILFEDPNFPADETSLFYSKDKLTSYKWLRPKEVSDNPLLFVDGTSRFDVIQGSLGNCWFAASLAGLARYKQLVYQVVPNDQSFDDNYAGIFHFRFWQYGKWIDIVIDDRLPIKAISPIKSIVESIGDLAFFKSSDQDEFWTALLEKAYAKLHGSYEALERGNSLEAMQDFTGGISEEFVADNIPENFFEILLTAKQRCSLMACCFHEDNENRGLEPAHAYTITDIKLIDIDATNLELIRIRNPWGRKEWTGNFCDQDSIWNKLSQAVKDELKFQDKVDGEFWMEFNDFKNVFTFVVVCNLTPESLSTSSDNPKRWKLQMLEGQWVNGATAGGSKPIESLAKNPQYLVTLEQPDSNGSGKCSVIISLMQRNRRSQRHKGLLNLAIGYDVRRVHNALSISKPLNASSLSTFRSRFRNPPLAPVRDLSCRLLLKPVTYCIIPFTEDPEQEGEYLLRIFSENGVKLEYFDEGISYEDGDIDDKLYSERSL